MASKNQIKENKMGIMPINKLLITMSLPMIVSMLVQALYNVVDSIFVSQINENALTSVSLAFPVQNFMIAVGVGTGVGVNALLSRYLGAKKTEQANKVANNGVFLAIMSYLFFLVLGMLFSRLFFKCQTDIIEIIEGGYSYLIICTTCSFGLYGQLIFEKLMQSTGKTIYAMFTQITGAIINIMLDPILIFGLFGFPKMGISGAALATVIGQILAMFLAIYLNYKKNKEIELKIKGFRPNIKTIKDIYSIGIPSIIMSSISSIMTFGMNKILLIFTSTATAVFGVYFKLQSFIFMPVFGINNGMVPIVSYNYGAKNKDRLMKTVNLSIIYAVSIMLVGLCVFQIMPRQLLSMFNASNELINIGVPALRIISISFIFAGYCVICGSMFQALGNGIMSLIVSVGRQLVVLLPTAYLLSLSNNLNMIWWAFPIAEVASVGLSVFGFKYVYNKKIKTLDKNEVKFNIGNTNSSSIEYLNKS